jgi:hypothetical protein
MALTPDRDAMAIDTDVGGQVSVSVAVFCSRLVERIAHDAPDDWDVAEIAVLP